MRSVETESCLIATPLTNHAPHSHNNPQYIKVKTRLLALALLLASVASLTASVVTLSGTPFVIKSGSTMQSYSVGGSSSIMFYYGSNATLYDCMQTVSFSTPRVSFLALDGQVVGSSSWPLLNLLDEGTTISSSLSGTWTTGTQSAISYWDKQTSTLYSDVAIGESGYVAFRFGNDTDGYNYGFANVTLDAVNQLTINSIAYESTVNSSISAVPEPAQTAAALGLAALGGIAALRRRKNA